MSKKALAVASLSLSAVTVAAGFMAFEEIMYHKPLVFPKVSAVANRYFEKKKAEENGPKPVIPKSEIIENNLSWFSSVNPEEITLTNKEGLKLQGYLYAADEPSDVFVLCFHGYTSNGKNDYCTKAKFWHDAGYNVLIVDHRCHGRSEGKWIGFGFHEARDGIEWVNLIRSRFGENSKVILQGISMGSATAMIMSGAPDLPSNVKCTVADCGYTSCRDELKHGLNGLFHIPDFPLLYIGDFFCKILNGFHFSEPNPLESVARTRVPILFVHGAADDAVPTEMGYRLYDACSSPDKEIFIVDGAGHTESHRTAPAEYEKRAIAFTRRFV